MKFISFIKRNGPTILTIIGCIGVPLSSYLTGKAVLEAEKILDDIPEDELKTSETQMKLIPVYIWAVVANVLTISDIIACHLMNKKLQAGYLAALSVISTSFEAMRSKLPPEELERIEKETDEDRINAVIKRLIETRPSEEHELWTDDYRKNPYWATKSDILLGKDDVNACLSGENYNPNYFGFASLEVFYSHVNGDSEPQDFIYGWNIDQLLEECAVDHVNIWWRNDIYTDPDSGKQIPCNHVHWDWGPVKNYWTYESNC